MAEQMRDLGLVIAIYIYIYRGGFGSGPGFESGFGFF